MFYSPSRIISGSSFRQAIVTRCLTTCPKYRIWKSGERTVPCSKKSFGISSQTSPRKPSLRRSGTFFGGFSQSCPIGGNPASPKRLPVLRDSGVPKGNMIFIWFVSYPPTAYWDSGGGLPLAWKCFLLDIEATRLGISPWQRLHR
jgi:hypothetical protein